MSDPHGDCPVQCTLNSEATIVDALRGGPRGTAAHTMASIGTILKGARSAETK